MANAVIREILRQGRNKPRKHVLAALTTGRVESGFRNLSGGDADSQGWRQERASLYRNPRNLKASVRRFYAETAQHDRGQGVGDLAADVQRPAEQYRGRYAEHLSEAKQILRRGGGTTGGGGGRGSTQVQIGGGGGRRAEIRFSPGQQANLASLLSSVRQDRPQPGVTPPASPAFSAGAVMPGGYTGGAPSVGPPTPQTDSPILAALEQLKAGRPTGIPSVDVFGQAPSVKRIGSRRSGGGGGGSGAVPGGGPTGKVTIAPGSDRAGVPTDRRVVQFAKAVSGRSGMPLTIGTGSSHSRLTASGNVSDHWVGKAADIPLAGKALTTAGRAALVSAGWSRAKARKAKGGIYDVNGYQIIFNAPDHWDHLHVGYKAGR